jgi:cobalt/nickel transport system permease protein
MTLSIAFPIRTDCPLGLIDPRWKLASLIIAAIVVAALHALGPALAALASALLLVVLARPPLGWFASRLAVVFVLLGLFLVFLPFANHGDEVRIFGMLSPRGMTLAAVLLLKALALLSILLAAAVSAPLDIHLKALCALRFPGVLIHLLGLTARYLVVIHEEFVTMRIALRTRGYRQGTSLASLRTVGHVGGMLLVRASDRAECVAQALRSRGFDGRFRSLTAFHTRPMDVAFGAGVIALAAALLAWDLLGA